MDTHSHRPTCLKDYQTVRATGRISTTLIPSGESVEVAYSPIVRELEAAGWITVEPVKDKQ